MATERCIALSKALSCSAQKANSIASSG